MKVLIGDVIMQKILMLNYQKLCILFFVIFFTLSNVQIANADITCTCTKNDYGKWECELKSTESSRVISYEESVKMAEENKKKLLEGLSNGTIKDYEITAPIKEFIILEEKDIINILEEVINSEK